MATSLNHTPIAPLASSITSVTWDAPMKLLIATSQGSNTGHAELLIRRELPDQLVSAPSIIRNIPTTIWCSSANSQNLRYAIGCLGGIRIYRTDSGLEDAYVVATGSADVLAMCFIDPNILSCGCRDGENSLVFALTV